MVKEIGQLVGWFDPGTKRFIYDDEKIAYPDRHKGYSIPVHAIHEDSTRVKPDVPASLPGSPVCCSVPTWLAGQVCMAIQDAIERLGTGTHLLQDCVKQIERIKGGKI